MSMVLSKTLCLSLVLLPCALGHGQLTVPLVRGDSQGRKESHEQRAPVYTIDGNRGGYSATSMRCHDFLPGSGPESTLQAGQSFDATWTMEAGHPGDCYFYISYDADPSNAVNFFKFAAIPGCGAPDGLNIPSSVTMSVQLPAELPPCEHCVLRWEWTAHQQVSNIEFYVQCSDVTITSSAGPVQPSPMTAIAGIEHLPQDAGGYRKVYNGQGPEEQYLVGPAIATYTPCTAGSAGCIGSGAAASTTAAAADTTQAAADTTQAAADTTQAAADTTQAAGDTTQAAAGTTQAAAGTTQAATGTTEAVAGPSTSQASSSLRSTVTGADVGSCPLPGRGLPSFVSECYCGFIKDPEAGGCGPDDGTACWCRCCCHYRSGSCRYQATQTEEIYSATQRLTPQGLSLTLLALLAGHGF